MLSMTLMAAACGQAPTASPLIEALSSGETPLTPRMCAEAAVQAAPEVEEALRQLTQAERARAEQVVEWAPDVTVSGRVSRLAVEDASALGPVEVDVPSNRASVELQVRQSLTDAVATIPARVGAEGALVRAARARQDSVQADLTLRAREDFWTLVRARGLTWVAEASKKAASSQRDRVSSLLEAGLATPADAAAADARLAKRQADVARRRADRAVARDALALLIARPVPASFAVPGQVLQPPPPPGLPVLALQEQALEDRSDLRVLTGQIEQARTLQKSAAAVGWPDLAVEGRATYAQPNLDAGLPREAFSGSATVGLGLRWSPDGLVASRVRVARLRERVRELEARRRRMVRRIRTSVNQHTRGLRAALERLRPGRVEVDAASEAYRVRTVLFDNGNGLFSQVLAAEADLERARQSFLSALVDAHLARARLDRELERGPGAVIP